MLKAFTLKRGFEKVLRAQLKWTSGDRKGAKQDLALVAREFSARGLTVEDLAEQAGLA